MKLKTSTFKPCHVICQLGLALDNVDGVKAVFLEPSLGLAKVRWGGAICLLIQISTLRMLF